MFVNDRQCNTGHLTIKEMVHSKDIELLGASMRPHYLQQEFTRYHDDDLC